MDSVGGSGEVTGVSIVTAGDYGIMPDVADTLTTTVAPAGGTGCTLDVDSVSRAGTSTDGNGRLVMTASYTVKTVTVRLPLINNGTTGWAFARSVEIGVELTTLTQLAFDATDVENATSVGIRCHNRDNVRDNWMTAYLFAHTTGATWAGTTQRSSLVQGTVGDTAVLAAGEKHSLAYDQAPHWTTETRSRVSAIITDQDETNRGSPWCSTVPQDDNGELGLDWSSATTATDDAQIWDLKLYAGPNAGDGLAVTVMHLLCYDMGWYGR